MILLSGCQPNDSRRDLVYDTYAKYQESISNSDGSVALSLVSNQTSDLYEGIRTAALLHRPTEILEKGPVWTISVLSIRGRISPTQLESMSGGDLFSYTISNGWHISDSARHEDIDQIYIDGNEASARVTVRSKPTDRFLHFINENGAWKMDTIKNWEIARQSLEWMKEKQNLNDQQVVTEILADMLGDSLNADIWIPTKTEIEPMKAK